MADSSIKVKGRIMRDPELRATASGKSVCQLNLSVYTGKNKDGGYNPSLFLDVICWEELGERVQKAHKKGDTVVAEGYLGYREWKKKDGTKQPGYEITAQTVGTEWTAKPAGDEDFPQEEGWDDIIL